MLRKGIVLLILTITAIQAKCDFIDYWHVYYNNVKKIACDKPDYCTFSFPKDSVKTTDSIKLYYYMDVRCYDCVETLSIRDKEGKEIYAVAMEEESRAQGMAIPVSVLIESGLHDFNLYIRRWETDKEFRILKINII